ncbi:MAG: hypothetical protein HGA25_01730 [Clostridiales bacterium]|nr:hypothetical protein [Clostridiales bacterium]
MIFERFCRHKLAVFSLCFLCLLSILAVFAPIIAPFHPDELTGDFSQAPTLTHLLGTDQIGRDMLSRLLYATRSSLLVGVAATGISTIIGVVLGLLSGFFGP